MKYVQELIDRGLLKETDAEEDRRVRFVSLAGAIETRLERFLRYAHERFHRLN